MEYHGEQLKGSRSFTYALRDGIMIRYVGGIFVVIVLTYGCSLFEHEQIYPDPLYFESERYFNPYPNPLWDVPYIESSPAIEIEPDDGPPLRLDPTRPFVLTFGRGSGWVGMNTVIIHADGQVNLHRFMEKNHHGIRSFVEETGSLMFHHEDIRALCDYLNQSPLLGMHKAYHAAWYDGMQWGFQIQQGEQTKSIYFNNHFPQEIREFSEMVDQLLLQRGILDVVWEPASQHE